MEKRKVITFAEFIKENLEFEEKTPTETANTSGEATATTTDEETLDFGEGENAPEKDTTAEASTGKEDSKEIKNKDLVAKLGHMIAILNSHRTYLKNEDADENLVKKINSLFAEFNKY